MAESMIYDYYYGDESNQFSFYRIPRQLVTGQQFKKISTDAKLLYGLLLDRMGPVSYTHLDVYKRQAHLHVLPRQNERRPHQRVEPVDAQGQK